MTNDKLTNGWRNRRPKLRVIGHKTWLGQLWGHLGGRSMARLAGFTALVAVACIAAPWGSAKAYYDINRIQTASATTHPVVPEPGQMWFVEQTQLPDYDDNR